MFPETAETAVVHASRCRVTKHERTAAATSLPVHAPAGHALALLSCVDGPVKTLVGLSLRDPNALDEEAHAGDGVRG